MAAPFNDDLHLHAPGTPVAVAEAPLVQAPDAVPHHPHHHLNLNAVEGGLAEAGGVSLAPALPDRAEKRLVSFFGLVWARERVNWSGAGRPPRARA